MPHELVGQHTKPGARRNALLIAGGGLAALVAVIVVIALANSPRPSVRGPLTYRGHGVSFDYPAGWQEGSYTGTSVGSASALWTTAVGPGTPHDAIFVGAYRMSSAVTAQNIDAAIPSLESLFQQGGMTVEGTPEKVTMAGLPGLRFRVTGMMRPGAEHRTPRLPLTIQVSVTPRLPHLGPTASGSRGIGRYRR